MIPDYLEPLTAYRAFDVCPNGLLVGQAHAEPWPPYAAFIARCGQLGENGHTAHVQGDTFTPAPAIGCGCGIHAFKTAADAEARVRGYDGLGFRFGYRPEQRAWGAVQLWGRVIEHETGYRAEFAYPSALYCEDALMAERIASLYGISCVHRALERHDTYFGLDMAGLLSAKTFYMPSKSVWITSAVDDASANPMIVTPPKPRVPMGIVGASRWQQRQYAKSMADPTFTAPNWRSMLRSMVYVQAIA